MIRAGVLLALAVALTGCADGERSSSRRANIVFGQPSPSPSRDDAVLLLRSTDGSSEHVCTATLIAPNLVVTARHCAAYLAPGIFNCSLEGELVDNPQGGGQLGADFAPERLEFHSGELPGAEPVAVGAQVVSSLSPTICNNDISFVVLDRALELPLKRIRLGTPTRRGELVTLVGYGLGEDPVGSWRDNPRRRSTGREVIEVGPDSLSDGVIAAAPRKLVLEGPSACFGDSGGPALSERTDAVIGVYSLSSSTNCTDAKVLHLYTHVAPFGNLIGAAFAAAGVEPYVEDDPGASGVAGAGCANDCGGPAGAAGASGAAGAFGGAAGAPPASGAAPGSRPTDADSGCAFAPDARGPARGSWLVWLGLLLLGRLSAGRRVDRP